MQHHWKNAFFRTVTAGVLVCAACGSDSVDDSKAPTTTGTDSDTDTNTIEDTDSVAGLSGATLSFCNPLSLGATSTTVTLQIGEGESQISLSAATQTCSNRLGSPCAVIPAGPSVPLFVYDENGSEIYRREVELVDGVVYLFYVTLDDEYNIWLDYGTLNENLDCREMECIFTSYNASTCAPADPCGWSGDGTCNAYCTDVLPDGSPTFDDSADCQ